jgi:hypothetical protein
MEPLNKKERTNLIIKFSAAFIIGILVIMIPFYFMLRLPVYENDIMTKDFRNMQEQMKYQKQVFSFQVDSVKRMVIRYDIATQDIDKLNAEMANYLNLMEEPFNNDTVWTGRMYKNIVQLFLDLKKAKTDKIKAEADMKDCKKDLEKAKEEAAKGKDTM